MIDSVLKPLGDALIDAVAYLFENIDIIDVLKGNSDRKSIKEAKELLATGENVIAADKKARGITKDDEVSARLRSQAKKRAADVVLERADDRDYGAMKTLEMLKKAGLLKDGITQNLTSEQLAEVFNTPQDFRLDSPEIVHHESDIRTDDLAISVGIGRRIEPIALQVVPTGIGRHVSAPEIINQVGDITTDNRAVTVDIAGNEIAGAGG